MAEFTFKATHIWDSMLRDCAAACRSIEVEQYILMDDAIGRRFLSLLRDKAAAGVKVRLLLDRVGSRSVHGHVLVDDLRRQGATVRFYNNLHLGRILTPQKWFPRNHAKTMMVDGRVFHIGSACMADYMAEWAEAHIRIEGETVGGDIAADFVYSPENTDKGYRYLRSRPGRRSAIYREMLRRMRGAKTSICLVTPYFLPPILLKRAMVRAARRGVAVRVLVAARPDVPIAGIVGQTYFEQVRKAGVEIYLYQPAILHAKYMVVDGNWAMLGSANLDYLSLLRNREANLAVDADAQVAKLAAHFEASVQASLKVDARFWPDIPWAVKGIGYLGRLFKKVL